MSTAHHCAGPSGPHIPQTELTAQSILSVRIGAWEETGTAPRRLGPSQPPAGAPWGQAPMSPGLTRFQLLAWP